MGLEGFTQVAQGLSGAAAATGALYNVFGYNPKQKSGGLDLRSSGASLPVSGGGFNAPNRSSLSFKPIESDVVRSQGMSGGAGIGSGSDSLGREHYAKLLQILGVPRG